MPRTQNSVVASLLKSAWTYDDLVELDHLFRSYRTLEVTPLANGLFAAVSGDSLSAARYSYVWLRDNVMVAHSRRVIGDEQASIKAVRTIRNFYLSHRHRFDNIIAGRVDASVPMNRPHIRFDGIGLKELPEKWSHAQNDALGYLLWLMFSMANDHVYHVERKDCLFAEMLCHYFSAIRYWEDADNGHWEEAAKVECSSIGAVVAGIREYLTWLESEPTGLSEAYSLEYREQIRRLRDAGIAHLSATLPEETPGVRAADAALLFLIYPLRVVDDDVAQKILHNVHLHLEGEYGIRRYLGDSYWCADYKHLVPEESLTVDVSDDMRKRDQLLVPGTEAQWSLFDPIISVIYAERFLRYGEEQDRVRQTHYFNRAIGHLTPRDFTLDGIGRVGQCPEAYYLANSSDGRWVPNDHVPLQWAQANLAIAFEYLKRTTIHASKRIAK